MREEQRRDRAYHDQCSRPSPNQHGFEEYISELDGPESPRYTFLLNCACLHSKGHHHLLQDDVPVPIIESSNPAENYLSDREAGDAISYMKKWKQTNPDQPWFMQGIATSSLSFFYFVSLFITSSWRLSSSCSFYLLSSIVWFNAPHGPWEALPAGEYYYNEKYHKDPEYWKNYQCTNPHNQRKESLYSQRWYYKTMVSAMDRSIGKILDTLKELDIEKDTLVVFTSDNGHEMGAGDPGFFKDGKRSLMVNSLSLFLISFFLLFLLPSFCFVLASSLSFLRF
jgi:hypothetical protein